LIAGIYLMVTALRRFFLFIILGVLISATTHASDINLKLLFTSDHHGQVLPLQEPQPGNIVGGAARRHTLIREIREKAGKNKVVLVDAGDLFYGSDFSKSTNGEVDCAAYQLMGYDAIALGNHDFDYGINFLRKATLNYQTPWISANIIEQSTQQNFVMPYMVKTVGGVRVGIIGFSSEDAFKRRERRNARGLTFKTPNEVAAGLYSKLKNDVDIFIALTHQGIEADRKLARHAPYLHVIIGGHDHRILDKPLIEQKPNGELAGPIIGHAGYRGLYLGQLELSVSGNRQDGYRVTKHDYRLLPVTADIPESAEMTVLLEKYTHTINSR
jgi:2',3'-cyclic-nucleotide 2'-phosphodiesterase (5'-nucleotidase family)